MENLEVKLKSQCKLLLNFFQKHKVWDQLKNHKDLIVLIPTDKALTKFASSIGLEVKQLLVDKNFFDVLYNHLGYMIPDPDAEPNTYELFKTVNDHIVEYDNEVTDTGLDETFAIEGGYDVKPTLVIDNDQIPLEFKSHIEKIYVINGVIIFPEQLDKFRKNFPYLKPSEDEKKNFNILDSGAILNILINLKPKEVVKTCQVDKRFIHVCENETLFKSLMKAHYPKYEIQNSSAAQTYKSIVNGTYMFYIVLEGSENSHGEYTIDEELFHPTELELRNYLLNEIYSAYGRYYPEDILIGYDLVKVKNSDEIKNILDDITNKVKLTINEEGNDPEDNYNFSLYFEDFRSKFIDKMKSTKIYGLSLKEFLKSVMEIKGTRIIKIYKGYRIV